MSITVIKVFVISGDDAKCGQPMSPIGSESFSESELQTATDDFEKKPLDTIPEGGTGDYITSPGTEGRSDTQQSKEEVTGL